MRAASGPSSGSPAGSSSGGSNSRSSGQVSPPHNLTRVDLQEETADVLGELIRFNTVNPPGDERECQE